ncbi:unnamed protein product [Caenorhabditis auriculariae]|uniref:C2H2-type domain-containing protein n=1 Tax=Caenorhabditis auriculariae TaxID=2777116 RepID=A0A8S1H9I1_9PELO|nr:unnamed protein product [Caenorhabditis auriculariae]
MSDEVKCLKCDKSFACQRYLTKHIKRAHQFKERKREKNPGDVTCSICSKQFRNISHLRRHQLTHWDLREWGCPFCEDSFVQKAHVLRHIARKHNDEQKDKNIEKLVVANRRLFEEHEKKNLKTEEKPAVKEEEEVPEEEEEEPPEPANLYISRYLCISCGKTFQTRSDLHRHRKNSHCILKCKRCYEIVHGLMEKRRHEMSCRSGCHICGKCQARFHRPADLKSHMITCLKMVLFECVACKERFKQRNQVDRHMKKLHFSNRRCDSCDFEATKPLEKAKHYNEKHQKIICGYCDMECPEKDHVELIHWRKLKRPAYSQIPVEIIDESHSNEAEESARVSTETTHLPANPVIRATNEPENGQAAISSKEENEPSSSSVLVDTDIPLDQILELAVELGNLQDFYCLDFGETTEEEVFLNIVLPIPDGVRALSLRGRLPAELVALFPILDETVIALLEEISGANQFLSVLVPVDLPPNVDASKWLSAPIYI